MVQLTTNPSKKSEEDIKDKKLLSELDKSNSFDANEIKEIVGTLFKNVGILVALVISIQLVELPMQLRTFNPGPSQDLLLETTACLSDGSTWITNWEKANCKKIDLRHLKRTTFTDDIVFVVEMSMYDKNFSKWQENLLANFQFQLLYDVNLPLVYFTTELELEISLGYSNQTKEGRTAWTYDTYYRRTKRYMNCNIDVTNDQNFDGVLYNCSSVPIVQLRFPHHDYYLLNVRVLQNETMKRHIIFNKIQKVFLQIVSKNEAFDWISLCYNVIFLVVLYYSLAYFWYLSFPYFPVQFMFLSIGGTLLFLDLPVGYITQYFDMPTHFLTDFRQWNLYMMINSFCLFCFESYMLYGRDKNGNGVTSYYKCLRIVTIACLYLFCVDLGIKLAQLNGPSQSSIWATSVSTNLVPYFTILTVLSVSLYIFYLWNLICSIFKNRRACILCDYDFLMWATISITVFWFILKIVALVLYHVEGWYKNDNVLVELSPGLHFGIYGLWYFYMCAIIASNKF